MKNFIKRLRFWLKREKNCKKCCLFCKWYFYCSDDLADEAAKAVVQFHKQRKA